VLRSSISDLRLGNEKNQPLNFHRCQAKRLRILIRNLLSAQGNGVTADGFTANVVAVSVAV
jgi:hypothetical protein